MKQICIDTYKGVFHPCEVESFRYNSLTKTYTLNFFDRSDNEFYCAEVVKIKDEFFVKNICFRFEENPALRMFRTALPKVDVSVLPPYLKSIKHKKIKTNDIVYERGPMHGYFIKKNEYLEIESYGNALDGKKYYYILVDDMEPNIEGFEYTGNLVATSDKPLKKRIIARHKTERDISDFPKYDDTYEMFFPLVEEVNVNLEFERMLINKIQKLQKGKRENMNPVYLTKIVRMMINSDDRLKAAQEYNKYLTKYYDAWIREDEEEKKYKSR